MITIIKIQEGYCVVDLNEECEVFDSLEEAHEVVGSILTEERSDRNKLKRHIKQDDKIYKTKGVEKYITHVHGKKAAQNKKSGDEKEFKFHKVTGQNKGWAKPLSN